MKEPNPYCSEISAELSDRIRKAIREIGELHESQIPIQEYEKANLLWPAKP